MQFDSYYTILNVVMGGGGLWPHGLGTRPQYILKNPSGKSQSNKYLIFESGADVTFEPREWVELNLFTQLVLNKNE